MGPWGSPWGTVLRHRPPHGLDPASHVAWHREWSEQTPGID